MSRIRTWLTYGNVTATVAVFLAMSGAAVAVTTAPKNSVTSPSIKDGEVNAPDLRGGAVTAAKIRPGSIGSGKVIDGSLSGVDIRDDTLDQNKLMAASVDTDELAIGSVTAEKVHTGAVGSRELGANVVGAGAVKGLTTATSSGTSISPSHAGNAEVTCPNGGMVVGGGYAWEDDAFTWMIYSTPSETDPSHTWMVRGYVPGGGPSNRLYAWATCLSP